MRKHRISWRIKYCPPINFALFQAELIVRVVGGRWSEFEDAVSMSSVCTFFSRTTKAPNMSLESVFGICPMPGSFASFVWHSYRGQMQSQDDSHSLALQK